MDDKTRTAIQMLGWYLILILVPCIAVMIEWIQTLELSITVGSLLISAVSGLGVLINRLIKLYFSLEGESPLEKSPA